MRGRGNKFCLVEYKSPWAQVGGFVWKQFLTLTRRSNCSLGDTSVTQDFAVNLSKHELEIPGQRSIPLAQGSSVASDWEHVSQSKTPKTNGIGRNSGRFEHPVKSTYDKLAAFFVGHETAQAGNTADLASSSCDEHVGDGETSVKLIIGGRQVRESLFVDRCHQL